MPFLVRSSLTHYLVTKMAAEYVPAVSPGRVATNSLPVIRISKIYLPKKLPEELIDITRRLHNTALQRELDGMTAANGLVAYMAFWNRKCCLWLCGFLPDINSTAVTVSRVEKMDPPLKAMEGIASRGSPLPAEVKFLGRGRVLPINSPVMPMRRSSDFEFRRGEDASGQFQIKEVRKSCSLPDILRTFLGSCRTCRLLADKDTLTA